MSDFPIAAALPPAMTAPHGVARRARARRRPRAGRARRRWQDWLFERTTMFFALFVLFTLVGIIVALAWAAVPAFQKFGFAFFFTNVWDPVKLEFGALAPIYGTLVTSAIALADRRAGQLRHRAVPHRDVPGRC